MDQPCHPIPFSKACLKLGYVGLVVKGPCCSFRGPEFDSSIHPQWLTTVNTLQLLGVRGGDGVVTRPLLAYSGTAGMCSALSYALNPEVNSLKVNKNSNVLLILFVFIFFFSFF